MQNILFQTKPSDSAKLSTSGEYQRYFAAITLALQSVLLWFEQVGERREAARKMKPLVDRLISTLLLMRIRSAHDPSHPLSFDLNDSGYPTARAFDIVKADLANMPTAQHRYASKGHLLDRLTETLLKDGPIDRILEELGMRSYLDGLKETDVYLLFTEGELSQIGSEGSQFQRYEYTFGTFCQLSNVPILYHMIFEVSGNENPLSVEHPLFQKLLKHLKSETAFESPIAVLARNIDVGFETIHPKLIQRIKLGPFWSLDARHPECESPFYDLLSSQESLASDSVLELLIESVNSTGTRETPAGFLGLAKVLRENFFIPSEPDALMRHASNVTRWLIMPHRLHRSGDWGGPLSQFSKHTRIFVKLGSEPTIHEV